MTHDTPAVALAAVLAAALAYEWAAVRTGGVPRWRGAAFMAGCAVLVVALAEPAHGFRDHVLRHLLVGMVAPLALVLGAPGRLLLRALPVGRARAVVRVLHARPVRVVAHPVTALGLTLVPMWLLYLTPLYRLTVADPAWHAAVQLHFFLAGYLFAWVVAGPDPAPRRPSVTARLVVLGVAVAGHAVLSQLLYAGAYVDLPVGADDRRAGATLLYYGGDLAELALAAALTCHFRVNRRHRPAPARVLTGEDDREVRAWLVASRAGARSPR
jgi:putative membrane protein